MIFTMHCHLSLKMLGKDNLNYCYKSQNIVITCLYPNSYGIYCGLTIPHKHKPPMQIRRGSRGSDEMGEFAAPFF